MVFSCDYSSYRERSPFAAHDAAAGYRVRLPNGLPSEMFRVRGTGGTPSLVIKDPHGQDITKSGDAITVEGTEPNTVLVGLRHPAAGNWTIAAAAGSVPIADVASADGLPDPGITARVTGAGHRRVLHYRYTPAAGRTVTFVERGRDTSRVLGSARGRAGTIAFTPRPGRGKQTVVAQISQDGSPTRDLKVATYTTPGVVAPARPTHVRATRRRGTIRVSWRAVDRRPPLRGPRPARRRFPRVPGGVWRPRHDSRPTSQPPRHRQRRCAQHRQPARTGDDRALGAGARAAALRREVRGRRLPGLAMGRTMRS